MYRHHTSPYSISELTEPPYCIKNQMSYVRGNTDHLGSTKSDMPNVDRRRGCHTNVAHPWLNAENIPTLFVSVAGNPDRSEVWIGGASDDLNLGEATIEYVHSPGSGENSDKDDMVFLHAVIQKDSDSHDCG